MASPACYTPLLRPDFFYVEGECEEVLHDLKVVSGDLSTSNSAALSAILIQLGSDRIFDHARGFWGDEFLGFNLGTRVWTLSNVVNDSTNTNTDAVRADEYIREALEVLVTQGFFDSITIRTVTTVDGFELVVDVRRDGQSIFNLRV